MAKVSTKQEVSGWVGWVAFAGVLSMVLGTFQAVAGIVALFKNEVYVLGPENLWLFDYTTWGWVHLLWGIFLVLAGGAILSGKTWGRVTGVILASVSALVNFAFIPIYPLWSIVIIALCVFVIYALIVHGDEIAVE
ncbi:MAG TPA: hypothetical protein PLJ04_02170 [Candidatus Saccharibacteria bacterium]|nr:hypothetical protein [Candidatus Saccharibacteria bacterium]MCB9817059.1 hypothetical protein [Candidatus Nomurabacteria bacterium]HPD99112.1 hypothetical protein [Candidatus Saccharibacteria bacterium]HPR10364.1 hypothetical protein [Candidatus Saccharibacteria bacterium]